MRKFLRNTLLAFNILFAVLLISTFLSVYVSPETSWVFAFIGMAYPFVLIINIAFVIFWILFKKWLFIISLICILAGWNSFEKFIQFRFKKPDSSVVHHSVKLLTYNVRLFNYYKWHNDAEAWKKIIQYIEKEDPDIVCFQEFLTIPGGELDLDNLKKLLSFLPYSHVNYTHRIPGKISLGLATFSKFPIIRKEKYDFNKSLNGTIISDIVSGNDTFRIYNCHLQSIRFRKDYSNLVDSLLFNYSDKQLNELKDVSLQMRQAFIQRAGQVDILERHIKSSPYPLIVCGDFNDTPISYTYYKLSKNLKDAFVQSGTGTGTTFRGNFPYVRIDYVLFSEPFNATYYHTDKVDWSDHYPVLFDFILQETEGAADQRSRPKE